MNYCQTYQSPLGTITLGSNGKALTGLWFNGQKYFKHKLSGAWEEKRLPIFQQTIEWLTLYFSGKEPDFTPELRFSGSPFYLEVWNLLLEIPYGQVTTYGELAKKIAQNHGLKSMSAQAVGGGVGHNPVSIIVPCHRVVGANGSLTGYAGGIKKKIGLLTLEGLDVTAFSMPRKGTAL